MAQSPDYERYTSDIKAKTRKGISHASELNALASQMSKEDAAKYKRESRRQPKYKKAFSNMAKEQSEAARNLGRVSKNQRRYLREESKPRHKRGSKR